jgi:hypothetical protein
MRKRPCAKRQRNKRTVSHPLLPSKRTLVRTCRVGHGRACLRFTLRLRQVRVDPAVRMLALQALAGGHQVGRGDVGVTRRDSVKAAPLPVVALDQPLAVAIEVLGAESKVGRRRAIEAREAGASYEVEERSPDCRTRSLRYIAHRRRAAGTPPAAFSTCRETTPIGNLPHAVCEVTTVAIRPCKGVDFEAPLHHGQGASHHPLGARACTGDGAEASRREPSGHASALRDGRAPFRHADADSS